MTGLMDSLVRQWRRCREGCEYPEGACTCGHKCRRCIRGEAYRDAHGGGDR